MLHSLCNKVVESGTWPKGWTQSIIVPVPKKTSKKCSDFRTISLISHPGKVLLKVIQRRLLETIESTLDQCQAGFRAGRETLEQVCNLRIVCEKYIENDMKVYNIRKPYIESGFLGCSRIAWN